ncbi:SDR family oxidoreductase [Brevibacillus borstelensis]|uniref:SDR family oxidoreductase n=1 Tax=Brevibacillus borstelensis TaxID=45462 RepID=UPI0030C01BD5
MQKLNGKIALVTGASRGIGRAIAMRLAEEGALVAVHYGRSRDAAEEVVREIEQNGGSAFPLCSELGYVKPGFVATDMNAAMVQDPASHQFGADYSIFGRWGEPADIADVAAFLASPESRWITEQCIDASGDRTCNSTQK